MATPARLAGVGVFVVSGVCLFTVGLFMIGDRQMAFAKKFTISTEFKKITGLQPGSIHGFHVHDVGNCASADFMSAGNHFNPTHKPHGPQDHPHHAGDMPSLLADPSGKIDARFTLEGVTLGGADGFVGHSVILHATADNFDAQPSGNSGARIACGVIAAQ